MLQAEQLARNACMFNGGEGTNWIGWLMGWIRCKAMLVYNDYRNGSLLGKN
jgi:hypothetical protein